MASWIMSIIILLFMSKFSINSKLTHFQNINSYSKNNKQFQIQDQQLLLNPHSQQSQKILSVASNKKQLKSNIYSINIHQSSQGYQQQIISSHNSQSQASKERINRIYPPNVFSEEISFQKNSQSIERKQNCGRIIKKSMNNPKIVMQQEDRQMVSYQQATSSNQQQQLSNKQNYEFFPEQPSSIHQPSSQISSNNMKQPQKYKNNDKLISQNTKKQFPKRQYKKFERSNPSVKVMNLKQLKQQQKLIDKQDLITNPNAMDIFVSSKGEQASITNKSARPVQNKFKFRKKVSKSTSKNTLNEQKNSKLPIIQFNPEEQKITIQSQSNQDFQIGPQKTQKKAYIEQEEQQSIFYVPSFNENPKKSSSQQQLIQLAKKTFTLFSVDCEDTPLTIKRYNNCIHFSINTEYNILWHYDNSKFYFGGWRFYSNGEGDKFGQGMQIVKDKYIYKGQFKDGKRNGYGVIKNLNEGSFIYQGQWLNGLKSGHGKQTQGVRTYYQGQWKYGKKHGHGRVYISEKQIFEGFFIGGQKNGLGSQLFENGDKYQGEYENGKFNGKGNYTWANGSFYHGQFVQGVRTGYGVWKSSKVYPFDEYVGYYKQGKKHGLGAYTWSNGSKYQGRFYNDLKHGQGTIYYDNGKIVKLLWNYGEVVQKVSEGFSNNQRPYASNRDNLLKKDYQENQFNNNNNHYNSIGSSHNMQASSAFRSQISSIKFKKSESYQKNQSIKPPRGKTAEIRKPIINEEVIKKLSRQKQSDKFNRGNSRQNLLKVGPSNSLKSASLGRLVPNQQYFREEVVKAPPKRVPPTDRPYKSIRQCSNFQIF